MEQASTIQGEIETIKHLKFQREKTSVKDHFDQEGKSVTKFWSNLNRENKPQDPIYSLKIPNTNPPEYTQNPKMAPLYKKKDKREIGNYHPIILLNTDYKIYTKALSIRLAKVSYHAIHPNQAGFMPGCSIFDQVKLAKLMISYAEATKRMDLL